MFIKKWQLIFLYIGWMDWGTGHLTIILETGVGHLPTKIGPGGGGGLVAGIDPHINFILQEGLSAYIYFIHD